MKHLSRSSAIKSALTIIATVIGLDQITKELVVRNIAIGERVSFLPGIDLVHSLNTGIAFSKGRGTSGIIVPILIVVVVVAVMAVSELRRAGGVLWPTALGYGLIVGGALSNVADRLFRGEGWGKGAVVDMVDLGWWPVFNLADSALSVGVLLVLFSSFLGDKALGDKAKRAVNPATNNNASADVRQDERAI
jgi:signal peptidase II